MPNWLAESIASSWSSARSTAVRPAFVRRRQSLYLRATDADQRELHGDEEPICQHQNQNGKYFEGYPKHRRRGIIA